MAAVPFKGNLVLRPRNGGPPVNLRFSASDVSNAFVTFDDLNAKADLVVPADSGGYVIDDVLIRGAGFGTDTTQLQVRRGTQDTTLILANALLNNFTTDKESRTQGARGALLQPNVTYFIRQIV